MVLAKLNYLEGDDEACALAIQKTIELNPNNSEAYVLYGRFFKYQGKFLDKSIELLKKANELDPNNDKIKLDLADVYIKKGLFEASRKIAEEILSLNPDNASALVALGNVLFYGDYEIVEAMTMVQKRINLNPESPFWYVYLGFGYMHIASYEEAIQCFNSVLRIAPESYGTKFTQAVLNEINGEYDKAFETYLEAPKNSFLYVRAMYNVMKVGLITKRTEEGISHYKKKCSYLFEQNVIVDSENITFAFSLGRMLKEQGDLEQANYLLNECLKFIKQNGYHGILGGAYGNWKARIYMALGDEEKALSAFKFLVEQGVHSTRLIQDVNFQPLYNNEEYKRLIKVVEKNLEIERVKLRKKQENGEIIVLLSNSK